MTDVPPEHIEPVKRLADAAHVLIGIVRKAEYSERSHLHAAELCLDIDLTGGGTEKWLIRVERVRDPAMRDRFTAACPSAAAPAPGCANPRA